MGYYSVPVQVEKEYTQQKTCDYLETRVLQTNILNSWESFGMVSAKGEDFSDKVLEVRSWVCVQITSNTLWDEAVD